jgi:DNA-binding XRE family transcriptional regulator
MCKQCAERIKAGLPVDDRHTKNRKNNLTLEERAAAMKARQIKIPKLARRMADSEVRRLRLIWIRRKLHASQEEMGLLLGIAGTSISAIEQGKRTCAVHHILLAETLLSRCQIAERVAKHREKRRREDNLEKAAALGYNVETQPAVADVPPDPKLRMRVIAMHIRGASEEQIAQELALRPEVVRLWISDVQ